MQFTNMPNKNACTEGEHLPTSSSLPNENAQRGKFTYVGFPAKRKCTEGKAVCPTKMHVQKENVYLCRLSCQTKMHRGGGLPMSASLPNVNLCTEGKGGLPMLHVFPAKQN